MLTPRLVIAHNTSIRRAWCALCNRRQDFVIGLELFRIDTLELVCEGCGQQYAPDLVSLLTLSRCVRLDRHAEKPGK
jgi:hypothetical protein